MARSDVKHLAVIPARGGSKRLPGKNLRLLHGKPVIAWSIEAALHAGLYDRVVVSTDSPEIAKVAERYGAEIPFLRPSHLAEDHSSPVDAACDLLQRLDDGFESMTWLQPTSPLRTAADLRRAFDLFTNNAADAVISVCSCEHSPLWTGIIEPDGNMRQFLKNKNLRKVSQELPTYHRVNGALFIVRTVPFTEQRNFYIQGDRTYAYEMPAEASVDIDTQFDFDMAGLLMAERKV